MIVNRTGAGFHRDSRREARFSRQQDRQWAIEESAAATVDAVDPVLSTWTIYANPADAPGYYVVRRFDILQGQEPVPALQAHYVGPTLEEARASLPPGLVLFPRSPEDDPAIVETWL